MRDDLMTREYLKVHGIKNVADLNYEEMEEEYKRLVKEGLTYYYDLLKEQDSNSEILEPKKQDVVQVLKQIETIDELYATMYEFLHTHSPTDLIAFMAEFKMPVPYSRLQRIIAIIHARVQDEILDSIKNDLASLPAQERETLLAYYEGMRDDVIALEKLRNNYKSIGTLNYLRATAETKLNIMQNFASKDLETEYKPFYDNSKEKRTLIAKILKISGIYTKAELFQMKIAELEAIYQEIAQQIMEKEREHKMMRKYIEIFEDSAGMSESEFKAYCIEMYENGSEEFVNEVISHFSSRNHFIANKINNALSARLGKRSIPNDFNES